MFTLSILNDLTQATIQGDDFWRVVLFLETFVAPGEYVIRVADWDLTIRARVIGSELSRRRAVVMEAI